MKTRARKLLVDDQVYWFAVRHLHDVSERPGTSPGYRNCREHLTIRRDGRGTATLTITFLAGPHHAVADGHNPSGTVMRWEEGSSQGSISKAVSARRSGTLNLHRPGVARALLDEALARGWDGVSPLELDGWVLFDAVRARLDSKAEETGPRP